MRKDASPPKQYNVKGNGYKTPIVQLDVQCNFIREFESLTEAAKEVGLTTTTSLNYATKDLSRTVKGFRWMYKNDYERMENG